MNWKTKDGTEIPISQMTTTHIENCIKLLQRTNGHLAVFVGEGGDGKPYADFDESPVYCALVDEYNCRLRRAGRGEER